MPYDLIIIGLGAAGLGAALYGGRYRLKVLAIGKEFGGETAKAGLIENYPGVEPINGYELMDIMKRQAKALDVEMLDGEITEIKHQEHCFEVGAKNTTYQAHAI